MDSFNHLRNQFDDSLPSYHHQSLFSPEPTATFPFVETQLPTIHMHFEQDLLGHSLSKTETPPADGLSHASNQPQVPIASAALPQVPTPGLLQQYLHDYSMYAIDEMGAAVNKAKSPPSSVQSSPAYQALAQPKTPGDFSPSESDNDRDALRGLQHTGTNQQGNNQGGDANRAPSSEAFLEEVMAKDLNLWTSDELTRWINTFRNAHFSSILPVFQNVTGFDVATLVDEDFRQYVNSIFAQKPSQIIIALSCWRQLRKFIITQPSNTKTKKTTTKKTSSTKRKAGSSTQPTKRRRKRSPVSFGTMLKILSQWQVHLDSGMSESSAARMLAPESIGRTTLRSWRQILLLSRAHGIDLSSTPYYSHPVSLSYLHKVIASRQNPPPPAEAYEFAIAGTKHEEA
jgi:hypothetical protein